MHAGTTDIEQHIVELFGRGDSSAMSRLYEAYAGYLSGVCVRYVIDADDRKDVLQESFIQIYTHIHTFSYQGKGSLRAWMTRVVINQALMYLRKKSQMNFVDTGMVLPDMEDCEPDVDGLTEKEILMLLGRLPDGYRTVFNLYAIEGKSHKEISGLLGIKPDSSASQYSRARTMLAKMITDYKKKQH